MMLLSVVIWSLFTVLVGRISWSSSVEMDTVDNVTKYPKMLVYTVSSGRRSLVGVRERGIRLYERTAHGVTSKMVEHSGKLTGFGLVALPRNDSLVCYTTWAEGVEPEVVNCGFGEEKRSLFQFAGGNFWTILQTDHLTSNLYWVDTKRSVMGVTDVEKNASHVLFSECDNEADGFDVDPYLGLIFACDHKDRRLVRRNADGTGKAEVIRNYEGICQGLTLDLDSQVIYYVTWNDDSSAYVFQMNYDGNNSQIVFDNSSDNSDLFGIKYFEGMLYVIKGDATKTENSGEKIIAINLKTMSVEEFAKAPAGVYFRSISFLENKLRKAVSNPCDTDACAQICLLSRNSTTGYKCVCGYGYQLVDDVICAVNSSVVFEDTCAVAANMSRAAIGSTASEHSVDTVSIIITLLLLCVFLVGILATLAVYCVRAKRRDQMMLLSKYELKDFLEGANRGSVSPMSGYEMAQACPFQQSVSPRDLIIDRTKTLGSGEFGVVYQGTLCGSDVAVKQTKYAADYNPEYFRVILREIKIMAYIGKHPHIVEFKGAEVSLLRQGIVYVVVELSPIGNLLSFLREKIAPKAEATSAYQCKGFMASEQGADANFSLLLSWAAQIADGMDYLGSKQLQHMLETLKVLHGDLAARNVLVFRHNHIKITDFGMSKHLYNYKHYTKSGSVNEGIRLCWLEYTSCGTIEKSTLISMANNSHNLSWRNQVVTTTGEPLQVVATTGKPIQTPLPWRWLALESIDKLEFSAETDVWAFGITVWEIFSYGKVPYPEYQWNQEFVTKLRSGTRLPQPEAATDLVYKKIKCCWDAEPMARPRFSELYEFFGDMLGNSIAVCSENGEERHGGYVSDINLIPFTDSTADSFRT